MLKTLAHTHTPLQAHLDRSDGQKSPVAAQKRKKLVAILHGNGQSRKSFCSKRCIKMPGITLVGHATKIILVISRSLTIGYSESYWLSADTIKLL